ncbi:hypothetical protein KUTeg_007995 [Tegillarca granosa]|uniref:Uncharacterized protein n=1 Tax=Tegillarca granosa TaxID=220873 RepID=A0ABQ9FEW1_TEGGR|nr:hypothetical protein KUTeg_007995 [Tegillarca granosa]
MFCSGQPNLIICPQGNILNTVLSVYSHEADQPLPQSDEVLVCSQHTTIDQLDIFWRRALFDTSDRVYCLVNADLLDYDVSDKGERRLEKHMEKATVLGNQYKLVVVCSQENELRSRIVAALDRFRRPPLPMGRKQDIRKYLQVKLKVEKIKGNLKPASHVDFDHSSVRVVKSWRAGVGKTLHMQRQLEDLRVLNSGIQTEVITIPLHEKVIDLDAVMEIFLQSILQPGHIQPRLFHIDISHEK